MSLKESPRTLDDITIDILLENVPFPCVLFNKVGIIKCNQVCKTLLKKHQYEISFPDIYYNFRNDLSPTKREIVLLDRELKKNWIEMMGEVVIVNGTSAILAFVLEVNEKDANQEDAERFNYLHEWMFEINRSITDIDDIPRTYYMILSNALKAMKNASLGSIFIKKENNFEVTSYIGFGKDIETLKLPVTHSFLYRVTEGKLDKIINVSNIQSDELFYPITTYAGDTVYIKSHLASPIYINNELFGMICVDSIKANAFNEQDIVAMEFIRSNVQIAMSNQLRFIEKSNLAMFDQLTNLYNRHYFNEYFELIKAKALRYKETFLFAFFDIDNLKLINDQFGHTVGDQAILKITQHLQKITRKSDIVARFGGDEFVGIFFASTQEDLRLKFKTMENEIKADPLLVQGKAVSTTFSFGIVEFPKDGQTIQELVNAADILLYQIKKNKIKQ